MQDRGDVRATHGRHPLVSGPGPAVVTLLALLTLAVAALGVWLGSTPYPSGGVPWEEPPSAPRAVGTPAVTPATPTAEPTPAAPLPLDGVRVVLDPGHNSGNATAAAEINRQVDDGRGGTKACNTVGTSTLDGYPEYAFTWDVADRARTALEEMGAEVVLTREESGVGPCVDERGQSPGVHDADLLVSIHGNGSESPEPHGFFAIVVRTPLNDAQGEPSEALAGDLVAALEEAGFTPSTTMGELSLRDDLATLNHATRPAAMLELAEFRNPEEAAAVQDPEVRQRYAEAIAVGIASWVGGRG